MRVFERLLGNRDNSVLLIGTSKLMIGRVVMSLRRELDCDRRRHLLGRRVVDSRLGSFHLPDLLIDITSHGSQKGVVVICGLLSLMCPSLRLSKFVPRVVASNGKC